MVKCDFTDRRSAGVGDTHCYNIVTLDKVVRAMTILQRYCDAWLPTGCRCEQCITKSNSDRVTTTWQILFNNLSTTYHSCETYKSSPKLEFSCPLPPICWHLHIALSLNIICVFLIWFCQNYLLKTSPPRFSDGVSVIEFNCFYFSQWVAISPITHALPKIVPWNNILQHRGSVQGRSVEACHQWQPW
jgi:hypothetical protein